MKRLRTLVSLAVLAAMPAVVSAGVPEPLRDAVRKAVVGNPEVQARWHAFGAATADQDTARGGYLPQIDLTTGMGRESQRRPGSSTAYYKHTNTTLALNQMVFDGFYTRSEVSRLGFTRLVRYYEVIEASEAAALEAVRAFSDVQRYRDLVALAKQNYVEHKQVYDQIAERAGAGVGRRVDLEQATGRLALAESNLLTEVSNLHDVSSRYQRIIGEVPPASLPAVSDSLGVEGIPATVGDALREAYDKSPTINASIEGVRAGQAAIDARRAAYMPRVDLRASQAWDRNLNNLDGRSRDSVVEVVMTYNLFRGGSDDARLRQAAESHNQAKDLREKACRDVRQTLSIAYNDVQRLEEQLRYLDQHQLSIEKAREAYRRQFDIGQRTLLDLLDTENEYFQARRAYANARYDRLTAEARTLAGMGKLMTALAVAREDLPSAAEVGQDRDGADPADLCPADAPASLRIDKAALLEQTLKEMGGKR